jgi:hypothetical protein
MYSVSPRKCRESEDHMDTASNRTRLRLLFLLASAAIALASCASTPPTIQVDPKGNIIINGINPAIRCVRVTVTRQGITPADLQFPNGPGLPDAPVSGGTVTIPTTQSTTPVTITAITVTISPECGPPSGTWTYTGQPFDLSQGHDQQIPWDKFTKR